jgi:hypothetical protein
MAFMYKSKPIFPSSKIFNVLTSSQSPTWPTPTHKSQHQQTLLKKMPFPLPAPLDLPSTFHHANWEIRYALLSSPLQTTTSSPQPPPQPQTLVLLHGTPWSSAVFSHMIHSLLHTTPNLPNLQILIYDLPGYGQSQTLSSSADLGPKGFPPLSSPLPPLPRRSATQQHQTSHPSPRHRRHHSPPRTPPPRHRSRQTNAARHKLHFTVGRRVLHPRALRTGRFYASACSCS